MLHLTLCKLFPQPCIYFRKLNNLKSKLITVMVLKFWSNKELIFPVILKQVYGRWSVKDNGDDAVVGKCE